MKALVQAVKKQKKCSTIHIKESGTSSVSYVIRRSPGYSRTVLEMVVITKCARRKRVCHLSLDIKFFFSLFVFLALTEHKTNKNACEHYHVFHGKVKYLSTFNTYHRYKKRAKHI